MFERARVKLTAWYLLIIMLISIMFSMVIYFGASNELLRIQRVERLRQQEISEGIIPPGRTLRIVPDVLAESRSRIRLALIIINAIILGISGAAGYFLAGRTLMPIEEMIDEQNKFVSGASHELRTPLTALKTSTEVGLRDKKLTVAEAKKILSENLEEVENLKVLTDSLLRLSQFEKLNGATVIENVEISTVFDEANKKVAKLARVKSITIELPKVKAVVRGEKSSLVELMVILLDNAIKYSPKGSKIKISASRNDGKAAIKVRDFGMGISKKDQAQIFERFFRGDKARSKASASGYGLGLSIAKKIVEMHGGAIGVESEVSRGSTFEVILPCEI